MVANTDVKKKRVKMLTQYEEDNVWMSYRYCIGRHTIAAHMHAGDIAQHTYGKIKPQRSEFMASDINNEIATCLSFSSLNFRLEYGLDKYPPLYLFYDFVNQEHIKSYEELNKYKNISVFINNDNKIEFDKELNSDGKVSSYISQMDFDDLAAWQKLSQLFNLKNHKWCLSKNPENNEEVKIEYFESYELNRLEDGTIFYKKYKIPVNAYLGNPAIHTYINEEYILKDNIDYEGN